VTTLVYRKAQAAAQRAALPLAGILAAAMLATGCGSAGHSGGMATPALPGSSTSGSAGQVTSSGTPPAAVQSPGPAAVAGPTVSAGQQAASGPGQCPAKTLKVTIGRGAGAAGSIYYPLDFTNSGSVTCTMYGYPGVAFVTKAGGSAAGGRLLGAPAVRNSTLAGKQVRLSPGGTAHASLQVQVAQNYPVATCKPVTAHWLQVYAPGSYAATYLRFTAVTCTGKIPSRSTLGIDVVRPGATGP
jgi:hypothetical protein